MYIREEQSGFEMRLSKMDQVFNLLELTTTVKKNLYTYVKEVQKLHVGLPLFMIVHL